MRLMSSVIQKVIKENALLEHFYLSLKYYVSLIEENIIHKRNMKKYSVGKV